MSEMISVSEMIFVLRKVRSFVLGEAMPRKPTEMAAGETPTAAGEMPTATSATEMATATTSSAMATASSTMGERGGRRERQNAGQNKADK